MSIVEQCVVKGCDASDVHLRCGYPECTCRNMPTAIRTGLAEFALLAQSPERIREFAESEEMSRLILDCARAVHSSALPIEAIVSAYLAALFREASVSGGGG